MRMGANGKTIDKRSLKVAGLFAGIGGFELGLLRAGHETVVLCENDPAAKAVLEARFPDIDIVPDVRDLRELPSDTDMIAAGFPCQDLSQAGDTRGIKGARSGLVSDVFRLLETHEVPWLLLENVPFMLQLGRGSAMRIHRPATGRAGLPLGVSSDRRACIRPSSTPEACLPARLTGRGSCPSSVCRKRPPSRADRPPRKSVRFLLDRRRPRPWLGHQRHADDQGRIHGGHPLAPCHLDARWHHRHAGHPRCRAAARLPSQLDQASRGSQTARFPMETSRQRGLGSRSQVDR